MKINFIRLAVLSLMLLIYVPCVTTEANHYNYETINQS